MRALVTGCAGFIGSHLTPRLLDAGWQVTGVDSFTDYYDPALKHHNVDALRSRDGFRFVTADLAVADLVGAAGDAEVVFHLAGQPGVGGFGAHFDAYVSRNLVATQRLLEAVKETKSLKTFVYAASSSQYGNTDVERVREDHPMRPFAPYGVTKLAAEHLCHLYAANFGLPVVTLRLFSVYGPRQRPDMPFAKIVRAALDGTTFTVFGDGTAERDFTYVDDVVSAFVSAAGAPAGGIFNVGGGEVASINAVIALIGAAAGRKVDVRHAPPRQRARQQVAD
ncbi:MAG: NAD-dependent epimerase/dehydratase family protein, partial [bacterium]